MAGLPLLPRHPPWASPVLTATPGTGGDRPLDGRADDGAEQLPGFPGRRHGRLAPLVEAARNPESLVTLAVVAACVIFTFVQLQPSNLLSDTTPAGGDMGAHVWLPDFVKHHLLGRLRVTGWTPDWYAGFPALTYYFPLPIVAIALLSYVLPYDVAFKLVSVSGLVALPLCAWAFGRLARLPFPTPACLATAAVAFLFSREFTIYGGNIASTMAGEFSFSISVSLALLFLGLVARGLDTGRGRALAAVVLAACAASHVLPMFFAVGGALIMWLMGPGRARARWLAPVLVVGGMLVAFWALPFAYRLPFATNMGYEKLTTYLTSLFPAKDLWLFVLAAIGALLAVVRRRPAGVWLAVTTLALAVAFRFAPQARLWNARVLPFWFLCLYLLVGVALAELGVMAAGAVAARRDFSRRILAVPVGALVVGLVWVGYPLRILPFGHTTGSNYSWLGISSTSASFVPDWVRWNYAGYQSPTKARRDEYFALVARMRSLGQDPAQGCGRAMWEYEPELDQMGTPDALMLLPYWTQGCIGSMEGLYYESSATTPYHFLNAAELSAKPSNPMRGLSYPAATDVATGVAHLQMLGVKYYMALTPGVQAQADTTTSLALVATVGPYSVTYTSNGQTSVMSRTWKIYRILDAPLVSPLVNQPVVMKGVTASPAAWLAASQSWYLSKDRWAVYETATGPAGWARVAASNPQVPQRPLPPVQVSGIHSGTDTISFDVSRVGVPVVVRTSYFPNWQAAGAGTVYRATPNLMIVVPTATHVTLHYGDTPVDWTGFAVTLLGLVAVVGLVRAGPVLPRRRPPHRAKAGARAPPTTDGEVHRGPREGAAPGC